MLLSIMVEFIGEVGSWNQWKDQMKCDKLEAGER